MRVVQHRAPASDAYQAGLESAFPDWPGRAGSRWYFERALSDLPAANLLTLEEDGRAIAGVALSYRRLGLANGASIAAAILTGAWTESRARGRGAFSRLVEAAEALAPDRGAAVLLAFATRSNGSCRALLRRGHAALPTRYWLAKAEAIREPMASRSARVPTRPGQDVRSTVLGGLDDMFGSAGGATHFHYDDATEWTEQFLARPHPTELVEAAPGLYAAIELSPHADRVLAFLGDPDRRELGLTRLRERAQASGRDLFWFECASASTPSKRRGFQTFPGAMTLQLVHAGRIRAALGLGPAQPVSAQALLDARSPCFMGPWRIEPGDRM